MTKEEVGSRLQQLSQLVIDLDSALTHFLTSGETSAEDVGEVALAVHQLKADVGDMYSFFTARVVDYLQTVNVDDMDINGARIEVRSAADRKQWQHADLMGAVAKRIMQRSVDMDTGEITLSPEEMVAKVLDYVQPSYWRVKELAKIGINADQFCEVGEHKTNLVIRKAK